MNWMNQKEIVNFARGSNSRLCLIWGGKDVLKDIGDFKPSFHLSRLYNGTTFIGYDKDKKENSYHNAITALDIMNPLIAWETHSLCSTYSGQWVIYGSEIVKDKAVSDNDLNDFHICTHTHSGWVNEHGKGIFARAILKIPAIPYELQNLRIITEYESLEEYYTVKIMGHNMGDKRPHLKMHNGVIYDISEPVRVIAPKVRVQYREE